MLSVLASKALANIDAHLAKVHQLGGPEPRVGDLSGHMRTLHEVREEIEKDTPFGKDQARIWSLDQTQVQEEIKRAKMRRLSS